MTAPAPDVFLADCPARAALDRRRLLPLLPHGEYDDSRVTTTVPDVLGRPARTFRQWAEVHAGAF